MASRADVEQYAQANRDIRTLTLRELEGFWRTLDLSDPERAALAIEAYLPVLVAAYGEMAAAVAADYFDNLRAEAGAPGRFRALMADGVDPKLVAGQSRWGVAPLFKKSPDPVAALGRLSQVADTHTLQPGRDTIALSASRDPAHATWARVPVGKTCAFCLMVASRGAVYRSKEAAGDGHKYHGHCDCTPTPIWRGTDYPEGYDPDALMEKYLDARGTAGSSDPKKILSALRAEQGTH